MNRPTLVATSMLLAVLLVAGCGSSHDAKPQTTPINTSSTSAQPDATPRVLEQAVRTAVEEDHHLAIETLWTNQIPANPAGIAGPALHDLHQSAIQHQEQGLRVRTLTDDFRVLSVQLEPSYTSATAIVIDAVRVQPTYLDGRRRGGSSATNEHVRLELRRVGNAERFIVWKVTLLP